jgi:predicted dehydrogenase
MIRAAKQAKRLLMVGQNNRYRGISQAVKRWIDAGNLGTPYYARSWAIRRNLLPPAIGFISRKLAGGGACMDIGVHCLDLTMWLLGFPEPVSVTGVASNHLAKHGEIPGAWGQWDRKKLDVEDFACGMIRFKNGLMLSLETSWLGHTPEQEDMRCMIIGDKAGVNWPSGKVHTAAHGTLIDAEIKPLNVRPQTHTTEIWEFYRAIVDKKPSPIPADQSLKVIKILDGIYRSNKLGREVKV